MLLIKNMRPIQSISYFCKNKTTLRQSVTILLIIALLAQIFTKPFLAFDYFANTAAYAKYCENKARPAMHCNGKCQLMKKMKQEENRDKQTAERKYSKEEVLSSKSFFTTVQVFISTATAPYPALSTSKTVQMPRSIFHPPGNKA